MNIIWDTNADGEHETKIHHPDRVVGLCPPIQARITADSNEAGRWYWEIVTDRNAPIGRSQEDFVCLFWNDDVPTLDEAKRHAEAALIALITGDFPKVQVAP